MQTILQKVSIDANKITDISTYKCTECGVTDRKQTEMDNEGNKRDTIWIKCFSEKCAGGFHQMEFVS